VSETQATMTTTSTVPFAVLLVALAVSPAHGGTRLRRDDGYGAPEPSYSAPASYSAPEESYGPPADSYGPPAYTAPAETGLDLTTLLIPLLALVGLFLLFPTFVTLTSVRRKRSADGEFPEEEQMGMLNQIQDMVQAVIESEECLERIACDAGGLAQSAGLDSSLVSAVSLVAPKEYSRYIKKFALPKNCHKIKCGNLF